METDAHVIHFSAGLERRMAIAPTPTRIKREQRDAVILMMRQVAMMADDEIERAFAQHAEIVE